MDLDFYVRVRTCKKRVTGKQPRIRPCVVSRGKSCYKKSISQLLGQSCNKTDIFVKLAASRPVDETGRT